MAYQKNLSQAASRHYDDARRLQDAKRFDNAGYHFGLSAECALKEAARAIGVRDDDDAIWAHFPVLKTDIIRAVVDKRGAQIRRLVEKQGFLKGWDIRMRYAPNGGVQEALVEQWQNDANDALGLII